MRLSVRCDSTIALSWNELPLKTKLISQAIAYIDKINLLDEIAGHEGCCPYLRKEIYKIQGEIYKEYCSIIEKLMPDGEVKE